MTKPYSTLTTLWHSTCHKILLAKTGTVSPSGLAVGVFDITLQAKSMEYELDVSRTLWMTSGRFTALQRDYLEPDYLEKFIVQSAEITPSKKIALSQMMCRVKPKNHPLKYRWGNCILGFTFRCYPYPSFSMHSRTTAITRMGGLDLALAYCIAKDIADERGDAVEDYSFTWHVDCMQHSCMGGLPYFYARGYAPYLGATRQFPSNERPTLAAMRRQVAYFDDLDERGVDSKFGTRRRIREQRRAFIRETMDRPAVPLSRLNLDNLRRKDSK